MFHARADVEIIGYNLVAPFRELSNFVCFWVDYIVTEEGYEVWWALSFLEFLVVILAEPFLSLNERLFVKPLLVLYLDELVAQYTLALVLPQRHNSILFVGHCLIFAVQGRRLEHASEDTRKVAQVEDVMELRGCRKHLCLTHVPQLDSGFGNDISHLSQLFELLKFIILSHHRTVDCVDCALFGGCDVEHIQVAFASIWNVIASSSRMGHGCDVLYFRNLHHTAT
mmetsp:Transcript_10610/g.17084  ORF Transcript_10610/g.17084 Transcript_10610/m.17084 type:complete len:226 (-) Transcript_10610:6188-6865(-)